MLPANWLSQIRSRLWDEREERSRLRWLFVRMGRFAYSIGHVMFEGQLSMRAMSMVYTTLLSLVPLLALSFSVLKAFGVQNRLEPTLREFLRPLGPQGDEITLKLIGFVAKTQVGILGSVGVILLFYTAISMIQKVESSFNYVWRIERIRPMGQRISEYLSVLMIGPAVIFSALGVTGTVLKSEVLVQVGGIAPLGFLVASATKLVPYLMIVGMFTFLYMFVPNTKVKLKAAAIGGLAAGVLWQSASLAFASFVAGATNYNAIYTSFAIVIFLLIWLYLGWLILLIGCQLAFYVQNPIHMKPKGKMSLPSARQSEYLALMIMGTACQRFARGELGQTEEEITAQLDSPGEHVSRVVEMLVQRGFLTESGLERVLLVPGRDMASVSVGELWREVRSSEHPIKPRTGLGTKTISLLDTAEQQFSREIGEMSVREWALSDQLANQQ